MTTARTATIDPRFAVPYGAPIIVGLEAAGYSVRFGRLDAPPGRGMVLSVAGRRVWVDLDDPADVDPARCAWADVTGKVNVTEDDLALHPTIRALGPVFGVTCWPLPAGYLRLRSFLRDSPRAALGGIRFQGITRLPIEAYTPRPSDPGYVFHRSRAWADRHAGANESRLRFFEAIEAVDVDRDIGLVDDRMPLADYLDRTRRSAVAFNAPAVHGCLGWKLGEYLALGKAIVSVPLGRALPAPLVHGEHIHVVSDDVDEMRAAVATVIADDVYRRRLEQGARRWFEEHLAPRRLVERLLDDR